LTTKSHEGSNEAKAVVILRALRGYLLCFFRCATHYRESSRTGRTSRISGLVEGQLKNVKLGGYVEADFLSSGTTSKNNLTNSYTLRQRQAFGQAAFSSGWTFTGGFPIFWRAPSLRKRRRSGFGYSPFPGRWC
jgi:hypothetical protein